MGGSVRLRREQSSASSSWLTSRLGSPGLPLRLLDILAAAAVWELTLASFLAPLVRSDGVFLRLLIQRNIGMNFRVINDSCQRDIIEQLTSAGIGLYIFLSILLGRP
jgi:hypothetical protein